MMRQCVSTGQILLSTVLETEGEVVHDYYAEETH